MGNKKNKDKKTTKTPNLSSGTSYRSRCKTRLREIEMKITRWKNNKGDSTKVTKWGKGQKVRKRSRHNNWDTSGLEKYRDFLKKEIAKGVRRKR